MLALFLALLATVLLTPFTSAQSYTYTVHASVLLVRTGDRTPVTLGDIPTTLTSLGAQQCYAAGQYMRQRYIADPALNDGATSVADAPLAGLSKYLIEDEQLYLLALDEQWVVASAQAFMQGLYPPYALNNTLGGVLDPLGGVSNGSYVETPLQGIQYPHLHVAGAVDPNFIFLGGHLDCPAFDETATEFYNTDTFEYTDTISNSVYQTLGEEFLSAVLPSPAWSYYNAYPIYDYLNWLNVHNSSAASTLAASLYRDSDTNVSYLDEIRYLADQEQYAFLGNVSAANTYGAGPSTATTGSISTIAGATLAEKVLSQLYLAIQTGGENYLLTVLFSDYEPFLSFFALADLGILNENFYGLPKFGSIMAFELFSYVNTTDSGSANVNSTFPSTDELWVRFSFRNGTGIGSDLGGDGADGTGSGISDNEGTYQAYPIFNRGPSETDMLWSDFVDAMEGVMIAGTGDWCAQCGATNVFCAAWNQSDAVTGNDNATTVSGKSAGLSTPAAGVVGAIVALGFLGLLLAAAMLLGGVRFHRISREQRQRRSDLGGFKGSQKLASDRDLTVSNKAGMVVGIDGKEADMGPASPVQGGRERVGSWELRDQKDTEAGRFGTLDVGKTGAGKHPSARTSLDAEGPDPFQDPVRESERV